MTTTNNSGFGAHTPNPKWRTWQLHSSQLSSLSLTHTLTHSHTCTNTHTHTYTHTHTHCHALSLTLSLTPPSQPLSLSHSLSHTHPASSLSRRNRPRSHPAPYSCVPLLEREFSIDNLPVRIHLVMETILVNRPCAMGV